MTAKPMKSTNDKIDVRLHKILMDVANDYANSINPELDGTLYTGPDLPTAKQEIAKLIKETLQECIGENEQVVIEKGEYDDWEWCDTCDHWLEDSEFGCLCEVRNQLRQEALSKLDNLLK